MHYRGLLVALLVPLTASSQTPSGAPATTPGDPTVWTIDVAHSDLTFEIRHFVSRVRGRFDKWKGTISTDLNDWSKANIDVAIDAGSINTNHEKRDSDLRTSDFFHADSFPTITFKSTKIDRSGDTARILGNLTMRGVTKPVVLEGKFLGRIRQGDRERFGFEASTTIDRTQWGIVWNRAAEGGGVMLGDDVKISIAIAATRPLPPAAPAR